MNTSDPVPLPPTQTLAPSLSDKASLLAGTPLAIVGVMLYENFAHTTLSTPYAVAVGSVFAGAVGYVWHAVTVLVDRALTKA